MLKHLRVIRLLIILAAGILVAGCSQPTSPTTTPPASSLPTAGQLADSGETIFASSCAGCHGATGEGGRAPAVMGAGAFLGKYNTAQGLLDFVSTAMPATNPGSLSHQEYLDVESYLLVQNNYISAAAIFDESQLNNLTLK